MLRHFAHCDSLKLAEQILQLIKPTYPTAHITYAKCGSPGCGDCYRKSAYIIYTQGVAQMEIN
jgi:hypothetical protein